MFRVDLKRQFHQTVIKWQPSQHDHVTVIAPPPTLFDVTRY